ncbi:hypothetical protein Tco_0445773 [Tanacetum coccineum]
MGGSSSQRRTNPPMSPINAFLVEELYTPQFSDSFQKNTGYWQELNPHESLVEAVATSPPKTKKPTRARQKRTIQSDDAPRQIAWTTKEDIALVKGWVAVSENNKYGNARKEHGFWYKVLKYIESSMAVIRFFRVYGNFMRMSQESEASDEDYINRALIHYQAETENTFKYRHYWEVLKDSPKWTKQQLLKFATESRGGSKRHKSSGYSSFNTESGDVSINLNTNVGDNDEDEVQEI